MAATATPEQAAEAYRQFVTEQRRQFETDPAWIADRADARALRLKPEAVCGFKRRHGLPRDQRLSPDARALLALELETAERVAKGEQLERARALALIAERATSETAAAIAAVLPQGPYMAPDYLLNRVEALTGKRYSAAAGAYPRAAALAPAAAPAAEAFKVDRRRRCLSWGRSCAWISCRGHRLQTLRPSTLVSAGGLQRPPHRPQPGRSARWPDAGGRGQGPARSACHRAPRSWGDPQRLPSPGPHCPP
jgi:hypothetical protein